MARLGREQWVNAAYDVFQDEGLAAVRIEALARTLGSTKGSFYWHFTDRRDLLLAVLDRWRELETEGVIAEVDDDLPPAQRLAILMRVIAHHSTLRTGERTLYVDAESHGVADVVRRVTERRLEIIESLLHDVGVSDDEAHRRAVVIVSTVLGYQQMTVSWDGRTSYDALVETLFHLAVDRAPSESEALAAWQGAPQV